MIGKTLFDSDTVNEQAALFAALSDPTRLKLLQILCRQNPPGCRCVNHLAHLLRITQPAVSQHLRVLKSLGLVTGERRGFRIHYFVDPEALRHLQEILSKALQVVENCEIDSCRKDCQAPKLTA